jgi:hypothetical protein
MTRVEENKRFDTIDEANMKVIGFASYQEIASALSRQ